MMTERLQLAFAEAAALRDAEQNAFANFLLRRLHQARYPTSEATEVAQHYIGLVLLVDWDPVGVFGEPAAEDEYDAYVPYVYHLLHDETGEQAIADYLVSVETDMMGAPPRPMLAETVAKKLRALWHEYLRPEQE